jgi:hypothetical protein
MKRREFFKSKLTLILLNGDADDDGSNNLQRHIKLKRRNFCWQIKKVKKMGGKIANQIIYEKTRKSGRAYENKAQEC